MANSLRPTVVTLAGVGALAMGVAATMPASAADPQIIELTQVGCQFIESEGGVDHGYTPTAKADCEEINAQTEGERIGDDNTLHLKPGKYVFRVTNTDVPYMLGFYLRSESVIDRPFLPSVSGGGLHEGVTQDYEIELTEGEYVYSCPLNITPDYKLVVEG